MKSELDGFQVELKRLEDTAVSIRGVFLLVCHSDYLISSDEMLQAKEREVDMRRTTGAAQRLLLISCRACSMRVLFALATALFPLAISLALLQRRHLLTPQRSDWNPLLTQRAPLSHSRHRLYDVAHSVVLALLDGRTSGAWTPADQLPAEVLPQHAHHPLIELRRATRSERISRCAEPIVRVRQRSWWHSHI